MLSRVVFTRSLISSSCKVGVKAIPISTRYYSTPNFEFSPGPPKLPKEQQEEFERLQNIANSQIAIEEYNDSLKEGNTEDTPEGVDFKAPALQSDIGSIAYLKTIPEFEGEINPKTGEVGGPKQDPLKHGDEWSYNGRVIDF
ncbi:Succinate dehydrogenase assembly factor 4 mitochondrial [Spathaspora sp. JA1]|nr:Succinate dehydrogenase assembly factor 4 mitochondrial [Spathaspora sp. JA1]